MSIIAIDFDNCLVDGDRPKEGAKEAINLLREKGHSVWIHSCNGPKWIEKVLNNADIRYDYIWDDVGKPIASLYIDDRALRYEGNWKETTTAALSLLNGDVPPVGPGPESR